ncbi:MAG: pyrimidine utilization protein [Alphaproteobacteria bacterium]|nr:pyrimidine utilization protein [Alphaproteobacteria bacterium]
MIAGLYFEEHGPAGAPPLILSAGLGGSGAYWTPNLAALARRHRVILYDHRGTGRSDRALPRNLTVEDMADDVLALIDGLGLKRAHFIGHAAGAAIGLTLALRAPERLASLVAVNGWSRLDPHFARCFEARLALLRDGGPRAYLRAQPLFLFPATWISEHTPELDRELESQLAHFPGAEAMEARIAALQAFDIDDRLGEIGIPVLAVAAKDDMLVPWTCSPAYADRLARGAVALMDWGGHACNVTDPATFNRLVLEFLRS